MRRTNLLAVAVAAGLLGSAANATSLKFDPSLACGASTCADGAMIDQGYGDSNRVDVTYTARLASGDSPATGTSLRFWSTGYGDLQNVIYAPGNASSIMEIKLVALNGVALTLSAFDLAGYFHSDRDTVVNVFDLNYNLLNGYDTSAPGMGYDTESFDGFTTFSGYIIQIGPDGFYSGLDNLTFSTSADVPEPASWAMMVLGFGLVASKMRQKSRGIIA